jgi:glycosyltransferase involved in cell wall biosynthesis
MKTIAVIPCLNEANFIGNVVGSSVEFVDKVIVVNDGSKDDTVRVAQSAGAEVVSHPYSMGAGAATRTGFETAVKYGADIVVTLDGDGQHDPSEIPMIVKPVLEGKADITIGSRFLREANISIYRKLGIDIITWLYNIGHKVKIHDSQSGFRAYSRKALSHITITYPGFGFSIETLVQARKHGLIILEVPITCIYHDSGSTEHPFTHGLSVACSVLKIRIKEELFNMVNKQRP